jgi:hypothetical protein
MPLHTRSFFFPAVGIGLLVAIGFFKVYGAISRPDVPTPVSSAITRLAPGVAIGKRIRDLKGIPSPYWVQNVGYVSDVNRPGIVQIRLLASPDMRKRELGDLATEVDGVELVGPPGSFTGSREMGAIAAGFGTRAREGCVIPNTPGLPRRNVEYWVSRKDRGGMAVLYDYSTVDVEADRVARAREIARWRREYELAMASGTEVPRLTQPPKRFRLASVIFWRGTFDGANTLRQNFIPKLCAEVEASPPAPLALRGEIAAAESLLITLGYRPDTV